MAPSVALGSKKSSTYPRGHASGSFVPAASLDVHFEHPSSQSQSSSQMLKYFSMLM
jgi:hypothetical protein